jgi:LmbE family N-acetylglucosaminyl deacetylase
MDDRSLPQWDSVLAVVAHPDDESFGLGAVLAGFAAAGARAAVLSFTHGEASTLHGVEGDLATLREAELRAAAAQLGLADVVLSSHADGALGQVDLSTLEHEIESVVDGTLAQGLLVFDPSGITGHPDHQRATEAAVAVGVRRGLGVLAWTLPEEVAARLRDDTGAPFAGHDAAVIDITLAVDRAAQLRAIDCHPSQAVPGSVLWTRLALMGDHECLRWLVRPPSPAPIG